MTTCDNREKSCQVSLCTGGSFSASGDMKAGVPGHVVIVASRVAAVLINRDISKSAIRSTLLPERSRWMIPFE